MLKKLLFSNIITILLSMLSILIFYFSVLITLIFSKTQIGWFLSSFIFSIEKNSLFISNNKIIDVCFACEKISLKKVIFNYIIHDL